MKLTKIPQATITAIAPIVSAKTQVLIIISPREGIANQALDCSDNTAER
jgi:hypothetical protein